MDRIKLRLKHYKIVLTRELLLFLKLLGLKNIIARNIESSKKTIGKEVNIDDQRRNIIVLPNIPWSYRWQRPQQILTRLAKEGFNIFYISLVTSEREYISEIAGNIFEVHIKTSTEGNVLRDFHLDKQNTDDFIKSINNLLSKYIKEDSLLFVLHPVWKNIALGIDKVKRIYDLMDLYSGFPGAKDELIKAEEELITKSDAILTTASTLYEFAKTLNQNVYMVKNGSDYEKFSDLKKNGVLDTLTNKPIVGYFGAITEWLDFDLMKYVIKNNRDKYFVFLGSLNTTNVRKLYKYKNVYFWGEVNHSELSGYLAYFDVCIIPFVLNDLIKSTDPVKFYEYIASGKPVVSVDLPELSKYSKICYLSKHKEDFSENISKAINEDNQKIVEERKKVSKENDWESRVQLIKQIITSIPL